MADLRLSDAADVLVGGRASCYSGRDGSFGSLVSARRSGAWRGERRRRRKDARAGHADERACERPRRPERPPWREEALRGALLAPSRLWHNRSGSPSPIGSRWEGRLARAPSCRHARAKAEWMPPVDVRRKGMRSDEQAMDGRPGLAAGTGGRAAWSRHARPSPRGQGFAQAPVAEPADRGRGPARRWSGPTLEAAAARLRCRVCSEAVARAKRSSDVPAGAPEERRPQCLHLYPRSLREAAVLDPSLWLLHLRPGNDDPLRRVLLGP